MRTARGAVQVGRTVVVEAKVCVGAPTPVFAEVPRPATSSLRRLGRLASSSRKSSLLHAWLARSLRGLSHSWMLLADVKTHLNANRRSTSAASNAWMPR